MLDVFMPGAYAQPPCSSCRPGPDGVPGVGWTLLAVGAFLLLIGIGVLAFASRTDSDSDSDSASDSGADADAESDAQPAASELTPVMDAVQREDLERRAAQEQDAEPEKGQSSDTAVGGSLIALGLGVAAIGLVVVGISSSRVNDDKSQLRMAAANLASGAIDGPGICRASGGESGIDDVDDELRALATPVRAGERLLQPRSVHSRRVRLLAVLHGERGDHRP